MQNRIKTIVRLRPLLQFEDEPAWSVNYNLNTVQCLDTHPIRQKIRKSKPSYSKQKIQEQLQNYEFKFDGIVGETVSSEKLYKKHCSSIVLNSIKQSQNCSIMSYGQTCSGKTYTTLGSYQAPGIIGCLLKQLFEISKQSDDIINYSLSLMQIYNENVYDLLQQQEKRKSLKIVSDNIWGCEVLSLRKQKITNLSESIKWVELGQKHRAYGCKQNHDKSSRSHTILRIYIERINQTYQKQYSCINILDLAGSERLTNQNFNHQEFLESSSINKSLFQLTYVINKLIQQKNTHIPFRDSKLTRILQNSLTGITYTIIICCISPAALNFNQSLNTLKLAQKVKQIQLQNKNPNKQYMSLEHLQKQLNIKNEECKQLREKIEQLNKQIAKLKSKNLKIDRKPQYVVKLEVLMDYQNFQIIKQHSNFLQPHLQNQLNQETSTIKQQFLNKIYRIYQQYTQDIVNHALKYVNSDKILEGYVKIQQICFMNMVYQHSAMVQYKIPLIKEMLTNFTTEDKKHKTNFYISLQKYYQRLMHSKIQSYQFQSISFNQSLLNQDKIAIKNCVEQNSEISFDDLPKTQQQVYGQVLYVWGYKKDSRVCKGQKVNECMIKIQNLGKLKSVFCGAHHSFVINKNGEMYGWGKNQEQQIIEDQMETVSIPRKISISERIINVGAGWCHTIALTQSGKAFSWGSGNYGQLGHNNTTNVKLPKQINHFVQIKNVYAGHSHSGFIDSNEDFYTFGYNQDYRLMIKSQRQVNVPTKVNLRGVIKAGLGVNHSCLITKDGYVYCGGVGTDGQLGVKLNETFKDYQEFQVPQRKFEEQKLEKICPLVQVPIFKGQNRAIEVSCGEYMTLIINSKMQLYSFGKNSFNRLGHLNRHPTVIMSKVKAVSAGCRHAICQDDKGRIYGWGFNMYHQIGLPSQGDIKTPSLIQQLSNIDIININCGYFHGAAIALKNEKQ